MPLSLSCGGESFDFTATLTITGTITLRRHDHLLTEDGNCICAEDGSRIQLENC
jgi:hypothetical protein